MAWVGHRDSKMVAHYRHLSADDAQRKMQQILFLRSESDRDGPANTRDPSLEKGVQPSKQKNDPR